MSKQRLTWARAGQSRCWLVASAMRRQTGGNKRRRDRVGEVVSGTLLVSRTHARRLMTLAEMANVAVFMASDKASGMTGTTVNLTMGSLDD